MGPSTRLSIRRADYIGLIDIFIIATERGTVIKSSSYLLGDTSNFLYFQIRFSAFKHPHPEDILLLLYLGEITLTTVL